MIDNQRLERPDVLIVGGSLGGVAAALSATRAGANVVLVEPSDWVGGQLTSQGVCTPDENRWIELGGATGTYQRLRNLVREHYTRNYHTVSNDRMAPFHPGDCWVSGISAEPKVWEAALRELLREADVNVCTGCDVKSVTLEQRRVVTVSTVIDHSVVVFAPLVLVDATDFGDIAPLAGLPYRIGGESRIETGEPDAPRIAHSDRRQPVTYPFALELCSDSLNDTIPEPQNYQHMKELQHYHIRDGAMRNMWDEFGWWKYRRVIAADRFRDPHWQCDVAMINTVSNDSRGGALPCDQPLEHQKRLKEAQFASIGYLRWLLTECPREDGCGYGYPELKWRKDWFNSLNGLAPQPYVRESRRLRTRTTLRQQDVISRDRSGRKWQKGPRSRFWPDSLGIGHYWLDIHSAQPEDEPMLLRTLPFQLPLGAFISIDCDNLIPACKNLGATRLASAALRLHPIEWAIGEAAGVLAAMVVSNNVTAGEVADKPGAVRSLQLQLVRGGAPVFWWADLAPSHSAFEAAQMLAVQGLWPITGTLEFGPDRTVEVDDVDLRTLGLSCGATRSAAAQKMWDRRSMDN